MPDLVVVVGPHGEETHTPLNARDLVLHVPGYSYGNGKTVTPADSSPYAVAVPPATPEPAKAVLDRYGSGSDALAAQAPAAPVVFKAPQVEAAPVAPVPIAEAPKAPESAETAPAADPVVTEDTPAPAKERQKRAPKSAE